MTSGFRSRISISAIAPRLDTPRDSDGPGRVPFTWTFGAGPCGTSGPRTGTRCTRRARPPMTELHVSLLYDRLQDVVTSPWDAYAAGISLDLLDASYHALGRYRYITSYHASRNAGRCAPTMSDVVLPAPSALNVWTDHGRNPTADFPSAPWQSAEYVKVSIGFLCAAGLTGAWYSLYFDDFLVDTGARGTDGDC